MYYTSGIKFFKKILSACNNTIAFIIIINKCKSAIVLLFNTILYF